MKRGTGQFKIYMASRPEHYSFIIEILEVFDEANGWTLEDSEPIFLHTMPKDMETLAEIYGRINSTFAATYGYKGVGV